MRGRGGVGKSKIATTKNCNTNTKNLITTTTIAITAVMLATQHGAARSMTKQQHEITTIAKILYYKNNSTLSAIMLRTNGIHTDMRACEWASVCPCVWHIKQIHTYAYIYTCICFYNKHTATHSNVARSFTLVKQQSICKSAIVPNKNIKRIQQSSSNHR